MTRICGVVCAAFLAACTGVENGPGGQGADFTRVGRFVSMEGARIFRGDVEFDGTVYVFQVVDRPKDRIEFIGESSTCPASNAVGELYQVVLHAEKGPYALRALGSDKVNLVASKCVPVENQK